MSTWVVFIELPDRQATVGWVADRLCTIAVSVHRIILIARWANNVASDGYNLRIPLLGEGGDGLVAIADRTIGVVLGSRKADDIAMDASGRG